MERPMHFAMWAVTCMLIIAALTAAGYAYVAASRTSDRMIELGQKQKASQDEIFAGFE